MQQMFETSNFDAKKTSDILMDVVPKYWHRKDFKKDFDYLSVDISIGWFIASIILTIGVAIGGFFGVRAVAENM